MTTITKRFRIVTSRVLFDLRLLTTIADPPRHWTDFGDPDRRLLPGLLFVVADAAVVVT
jgi:hypothetical protein